MQTITVERDIDQDRFITYDRYKLFLRTFKPVSQRQLWFMIAGVTGWRPVEICRTHINDIDALNNRIKWRLAKPKTAYKRTYTFERQKTYRCESCRGKGYWKKAKCEVCDGEGRLKSGDEYMVKTHKIKYRYIPPWAMDMITNYIKKNYLTMKEGYLFPGSKDGHMQVGTAEEWLREQRDKLYKEDISKWAWVKEPYQKIVYPNGKVQKYFKLSLYAFRKMHATYYAQMLLERGIADVLLNTSQHMGHSDPRVTMMYIKSMMDEGKMARGFEKAIDIAFDFAASMPTVPKTQKKLDSFFTTK